MRSWESKCDAHIGFEGGIEDKPFSVLLRPRIPVAAGGSLDPWQIQAFEACVAEIPILLQTDTSGRNQEMGGPEEAEIIIDTRRFPSRKSIMRVLIGPKGIKSQRDGGEQQVHDSLRWT